MAPRSGQVPQDEELTMASRKSASCFGRVSGKPLTEYDSQGDAERGAEHARAAYGRDLVTYACQRCGRWHLAPADRQTPSTTCYGCRGRNGRAKAAYETYEDADRRASILATEEGVYLQPYACPYGSGWHLTKG